MTISIDISPAVLREMERRAERTGSDAKRVVEQIVARSAPSLAEAAASIHDDFARSGMTQEDLDVLTDELIAEVRSETPLRSR